MSNFINDVINADALIGEIDDYIENWHNLNSDISVYDYLGMTKEEYFLWVENEFYLKYIISAHQKNIDINTLLAEEYSNKLTARSASPTEAKAIYDWLREKGLITE